MRGEQWASFTSVLARLYTWISSHDWIFTHLFVLPSTALCLTWITKMLWETESRVRGSHILSENWWQVQWSLGLPQIQPGSIPGFVLFTFFSSDLEEVHSHQVCRCCQFEGVRQKSSRSGLACRGTWTGWWIRTTGTWWSSTKKKEKSCSGQAEACPASVGAGSAWPGAALQEGSWDRGWRGLTAPRPHCGCYKGGQGPGDQGGD